MIFIRISAVIIKKLKNLHIHLAKRPVNSQYFLAVAVLLLLFLFQVASLHEAKKKGSAVFLSCLGLKPFSSVFH